MIWPRKRKMRLKLVSNRVNKSFLVELCMFLGQEVYLSDHFLFLMIVFVFPSLYLEMPVNFYDFLSRKRENGVTVGVEPR